MRDFIMWSFQDFSSVAPLPCLLLSCCLYKQESCLIKRVPKFTWITYFLFIGEWNFSSLWKLDHPAFALCIQHCTEDIFWKFLCSLYAFIILHMLVHAADIYFWRRYRINYPFLFNLKQGTELGYREIFVISSGLAVLVLSTFLVQLHIRMDSNIQENVSRVELVPLVLLIVRF